ncbi:50S ribosomal protein L15 [PVC group bacterium (ex Bugula neritina AB1)]|nr:50S ribosomal protein L15 [PVC group bacterium (ex Bugula neritina AB1)]
MQLHDLSPAKNSRFSRKRVGRGDGSGLGKTSGRGEKGQNARSGGGVRLGFEGGQMPLIRRVPKRGFVNIFAKEYVLVHIRDLSCFEEGSKVRLKDLEAKGLIPSLKKPVKLLADGDLAVSLDIKVNAFSVAAKAKIEKAGGKLGLI